MARGEGLDEPGALRRMLREFAIQDWFILCYLIVLNLSVYAGEPGPARDHVQMQAMGLLTLFIGSVAPVRSGALRDGFFAPFVYRMGVFGSIQLSYFMLRWLLPVVRPTSLDRELYALDIELFGFEPAMWMDQFVNPTTTEWFAFFYFSYFFLLAVHVIGILFFVKHRQLLGEFCFGMIALFCIGHVVYMLVPGYGPYRAMADHFQNELPPGLWLDMVVSTVSSGGAQKDIFPSIHTAAPTFIALLSFRHRHRFPYSLTWPVVTLVALNIIIATMFLRWHYVIDVVAGLALAGIAFTLSSWCTQLELPKRDARGLMPVWPEFRSFTSRG